MNFYETVGLNKKNKKLLRNFNWSN